ncbi:MAG: hypothetical protein M0042_02705 [Nitrospiraceae bacterium]|nr:hypothetical protein [Nitrospiraceae bacterium]
MRFKAGARLFITIIALTGGTLLPSGVFAAEKANSPEIFKQHLAEVRKNPESVELREKVIKYAQGLKQKPAVPEEYERQLSRGTAFLKMANDAAGYLKAADEFKAAVAAAPWLAEGYVNLAAAQEKAQLYSEAIQNLNFAILADPNGKNSREWRNRVYELEVFAEEANQKLKASPVVPPPAPPAPPTVAKPTPPKKQPAAAQEKKTNPKAFVGNWFYKDVAPRGGEEITTQAFSITMNQAGELIATAPRRSSGALGSISIFEVAGDSIHIQVSWKLASIPTYWKTEDYEVTLSDDESKLSGSYRVKSSGKNEFSEDKALFKQ